MNYRHAFPHITFSFGDGIWDAVFDELQNPDVGFSFLDSPFGLDSFDFFPAETDYTYQDIFTGMVFYKPIEQHIMSVGIPEIFDDQFMNELIRRQQVSGDKRTEEEMKSDYLQLKEIENYVNGVKTFY